MITSDPAGIVSRVPELEALASHPGIRRAIERGDVHGLYRRLYWAQLFGRLPEHREALRMLVGRRRLFLRPLKSAPTLFTYNGIGTTAYGRDDVDPSDQTYVLTQVLCFLFVPVFPLAQFLVRDAPSSG